MLRSSEDYLSVNWLEFLNLPTRAKDPEAKRLYRAKIPSLRTLGTPAAIAVLPINRTTAKLAQAPINLAVTFLHEPAGLDPSHSGLYYNATVARELNQVCAELLLESLKAQDVFQIESL